MKKAVVRSILVVVILLAVTVVAAAQQPKKVPRIGYLSSGNPHSDSSRYEPIRLALRELGYIENQNLTTEHRYAEGKTDRRNELAADLPVQQPAKFEFVINLQTAKQIGVRIPLEVLARATRLIK